MSGYRDNDDETNDDDVMAQTQHTHTVLRDRGLVCAALRRESCLILVGGQSGFWLAGDVHGEVQGEHDWKDASGSQQSTIIK